MPANDCKYDTKIAGLPHFVSAIRAMHVVCTVICGVLQWLFQGRRQARAWGGEGGGGRGLELKSPPPPPPKLMYTPNRLQPSMHYNLHDLWNQIDRHSASEPEQIRKILRDNHLRIFFIHNLASLARSKRILSGSEFLQIDGGWSFAPILWETLHSLPGPPDWIGLSGLTQGKGYRQEIGRDTDNMIGV